MSDNKILKELRSTQRPEVDEEDEPVQRSTVDFEYLQILFLILMVIAGGLFTFRRYISGTEAEVRQAVALERIADYLDRR